jgi:hypothetical protein
VPSPSGDVSAEPKESPTARVAAWICIAFFLAVGLSAAWSVDIVEAGGGLKGDEATYAAMALSVAGDGDLAYERRDLERFWAVFRSGPEGIFLKRGSSLSVGRCDGWPCLTGAPLLHDERLYFGKSFAYSLAAAPLVWMAGINGMLVLNVLLLGAVVAAGYRFLEVQGAPVLGLGYALAYLGVSIVPIYLVWLTPEIFNFALVFLAYFCWLYPEVAPRAASTLLARSLPYVGAALLGVATFSKPSHALLALPPVLYALIRRRWKLAVVFAATFGAITAGGFVVNALVSGELNYQGGAHRKTFYGHFPFENPGATFDGLGIRVATDQAAVDLTREQHAFVPRLLANAWYFLVGRYTGLVPYYFPAIVALCLFLVQARRRPAWQWMTAGVALLTALVLLLWLPFTWAGGGGPPGNRYFLGVYPVLFFLVPARLSWWQLAVATVGGALFTAPMIVNPFVSSARPWMAAEQGPARALPVELTMVNDLPIMINPRRSRIPYGSNPQLFLYLLDENAWPPEPNGIWTKGQARADIIVRTGDALSAVRLDVNSPVQQRVRVDGGAGTQEVDMRAQTQTSIVLPVSGVYARQGYSYLISVRADRGFIPRFLDPASQDGRFLGVQINVQGLRPLGQDRGQ